MYLNPDTFAPRPCKTQTVLQGKYCSRQADCLIACLDFYCTYRSWTDLGTRSVYGNEKGEAVVVFTQLEGEAGQVVSTKRAPTRFICPRSNVAILVHELRKGLRVAVIGKNHRTQNLFQAGQLSSPCLTNSLYRSDTAPIGKWSH